MMEKKMQNTLKGCLMGYETQVAAHASITMHMRLCFGVGLMRWGICSLFC